MNTEIFFAIPGMLFLGILTCCSGINHNTASLSSDNGDGTYNYKYGEMAAQNAHSRQLQMYDQTQDYQQQHHR